MSSRSSGEFCPRCGEPVPDREAPLPGDPQGRRARLCDACYFEDFDLVDAPGELVIPVCSECGAVQRDDRWRDLDDDEDYTGVAVEAVTESLAVHVDATDVRWGVEPEQVDANTLRMHCEFSGVVRGTAVEADHEVQVQFSGGRCGRCSRIAGNSYAATIQVRAEGRDPTDEELSRAVSVAREFVAERERKGDRNAYITEVGETEGGVDVRVSTTQLGRAIAERVRRRLGGEVSDSRRLITEDGDGNEVYRMAYAVRLPPYPAGTVVEPEGDDPVLVRSAHGNLKGEYLTTGERYEATSEEGIAPAARRLGHVEDARETTLVAVEDERAVQVLDPDTFETRTVARPSYLDPDADTVHVLKHREGLHVLPEDAVEGGSDAGSGK